MKLHEYQAKQLFATAGIPVPHGEAVTTPEAAADAYERLKSQLGATGAFSCNVKAQLHAGGRGKAGGIRVAASSEEARRHARELNARFAD